MVNRRVMTISKLNEDWKEEGPGSLIHAVKDISRST